MTFMEVPDAARAEFMRLGLLIDEGPHWWGALAGLQRADDAYKIFSPDRRAQLDALARVGSDNPANLTQRDHAFFRGLAVEAGVVLIAEART